MITDISERKQLENKVVRLNRLLEQQVLDQGRALSRSQLLYRTVARNYPNGTIWVLDEQFRCEFAEGKQLFALHITSEELHGRYYPDQLPEGIREAIVERLRRVLGGEDQSFELEHNGEHFRVEAVAIEIEGDQESRILLVEQNITETMQALFKERQLNELKSRFVSMASHEFRTPLSTISSSAELVEAHWTRGNRERGMEHLGKIKRSVQHLVGILDDYLSLEKFESGTWQGQLELLDMPECVGRTLDAMETSLKQRQRLVREGMVAAGGAGGAGSGAGGAGSRAGDAGSRAGGAGSRAGEWGHPAAVHGIVSNLVSNASKYAPEGTEIRVGLNDRGDRWELTVADQGIGIPPEEAEHVFERFFRGGEASHVPGTGVGLDLVNRCVQALGGTIRFESRVGEGTCFEVVWPKRFAAPSGEDPHRTTELP
jgi:signal transduction histidine kinase